MTSKPVTEDQVECRVVCINHWQNCRRIRITKNQIGVQVTVPSCSHCSTCQRRVMQFTDLLARKPTVEHEWKWLEDGAKWLFLKQDKPGNPLDFLRETLEVWIEER